MRSDFETRSSGSPRESTRRRGPPRLLLRLALALAAPAVLVLLLEGGLRLSGVGRDLAFFIPDDQPGVYRTNPHFTELFFPPSFGLKPVNFRLTKAKPAGALRVFVIGESAAMGVPEPGFALAPQLRAQLRAAYPDRTFEVYNLGITAINSHAIRRIVDQAVAFQPDLLVIYMGNNEVVGPYGPSSVATHALPPLWLIRARLWLRTTRTGQLLQRTLAFFGGAGGGFQDWRGMEMFTGKTVAAGDRRMPAVYRNFSSNLAAMIDRARAAGVHVLLSTVAVNLQDCAPFASLHAPGLSSDRQATWQKDFDEAERAMDRGELGAARSGFERALAIDPEYADAHFLLARVLAAQGDEEAARRHYLQARDGDALRFRADTRLNEILRAAAAADPGTVTLVDAAAALGAGARSTGAIAGHRYFFEHVHLTWDGNFALARLLAGPAGRLLTGAPPAGDAWLDEPACAAAVGFTDYGRATMDMTMDGLTGRPPFTGQRTFAADRAWLQAQVAAANQKLSASGAMQAVAAAVDQALARDPQNPFLAFHAASVHAQLGEFARALSFNDTLATLEPPSPEQAAQRAFLLQELGRGAEAEKLLLGSAARDPFYFQTYELLGRFWAEAHQFSQAVDYFSKLVARMPDSLALRHVLAQVLAGNGEEAQAEEQWRTILRLSPDDEGALEPLCTRMLRRGRVDEAIGLMQAAFAYNPRSYANNARLVQVFDQRGDVAATVQYMQALAASGPVNAALHLDLAANLRRLGREDEARVELQRARRTAADQGDQAALGRAEEQLRQ